MYVCHCRAVTDRTITAAIASGASTIEEVGRRCRAGTGCGGCHQAIEALLESVGSWETPEAAASPAA